MASTTAASTLVAAATAAAAATTAAADPPILTKPVLSFAAVVSSHHGGPPESPRACSKSFAEITQNNGKIKIKQPRSFRGEPAAFFSKEEVQVLASPLRYTLVGKFLFKRPSMETIRKFFTSLGLKGLKSVGLLQENHVAVFINNGEDYARLLLRTTWYVSGCPMKIFKWSPNFNPSVESPVMPVWLGLPGLPLHLFDKAAIFNIASAFGTPLKIDEPTANLSRPTVARVCIELDVSQPRHHRIWIGEEKEGFWQEVVFENPPSYCGFCQMIGHEEKACYVKHPSLRNDPKKVVLQEESRVHKSSGISLNGKENGRNAEIWRKKNTQPQPAEKGKEKEDDWNLVQSKKNKHSSHNTKALNTMVEKAEETNSRNQLLQPRKVVANAEVPSFDIPSAEPFTMAISSTPFPNLEKLKKTQKPLNSDGNEIHPSDQIQFQILPLDKSGEQKKKGNSGTVLVLSDKDNQPLDHNPTKGSDKYGEKKTEGTTLQSISGSFAGNSKILEIDAYETNEDNEGGLLAGAGLNSENAEEISKIQPLINPPFQIRPSDQEVLKIQPFDVALLPALDADKASSAAVSTADKASEMLQKKQR